MATSLGLGTAQFGLDYGVSNRVGKCPPSDVAGILNLAVEHSVRIIDTAATYGESGKVLGAALPSDHCFAVVTKTPAIAGRPFGRAETGMLEETFTRSLSRLGLGSVYGLLAHQSEDLLVRGGERLFETMVRLKERGLVDKIGVSIYTGAEIDAVLDRHPIDLIQVPVSVFDQRLIASGHLAKLRGAGIEIHIRSAFLQGLLLLAPERVPVYFKPIHPHLCDYHRTLRETGVSPVEAALGFVRNLSEADCVLVGVRSRAELSEILEVDDVSGPDLDYGRFAILDEAMINPIRWPKF